MPWIGLDPTWYPRIILWPGLCIGLVRAWVIIAYGTYMKWANSYSTAFWNVQTCESTITVVSTVMTPTGLDETLMSEEAANNEVTVVRKDATALGTKTWHC